MIRCINPSYTYNVTGEALLSSSQVKGWVNYSQILPGVYDVELRNPDGQISVLPAALTIAPRRSTPLALARCALRLRALTDPRRSPCS